MKILFLTPQLPYPPRQGTQIRNYHLIRAAGAVHEVDLLSFARPGETLESAGPLREMCGRIHLVPAPVRAGAERLRVLLTSVDPDMAHRLRSEGFSATLRQVLTQSTYDVVQVEGIELARYVPQIRAIAPKAKIVFDDHNAEYLLQARAAAVDARHPPTWPKAVYSAIQWQKLRRHESQVCREVDAVLAVSEDDAEALNRLGATAPVTVVPNGVDTAYYCLDRSSAVESATMLFTGTMDFRPNVDAVRWFASRVLPSIATQHPGARFEIVGRSPSPAVQTLAMNNPSVVVTGSVEDVRPYMSRATAFVIPMRMGGGVRLKILEALAAGVPVVSTGMGAEGTGLTDGRELLIADIPREFAGATLRLIEDAALRQRVAAAGREAVVQRFEWNRIGPRLLQVYERLKEDKMDEGTG